MTIARPGRIAKLADVAKAAGVSAGTVSNVFNRPEVVRPEVRERVRKVAGDLGYTADPKGRLLRAGKVNAIGVAVVEPLSHFFTDPFGRVLMVGVTEAAQAHGAGVSLVSLANKEELAWNVRNAVVDGFVLLCMEDSHALIRAASQRNLPFVALSLGRDSRGISVVGIDNVAGARAAAMHLAELGHRRFAILTMRLDDSSFGRVSRDTLEATIDSEPRDRVHGYFQALAEYGIDVATVPIFATQEDDRTIHAALDQMFASSPRPTAILAQSDRIALAALDWLKAHGIAVPRDVSIVGFDGVPESATSTPPLTTVVQPIVEIGRRAANRILDYDGIVRRETVDFTFAVRGSTAPPAG